MVSLLMQCNMQYHVIWLEPVFLLLPSFSGQNWLHCQQALPKVILCIGIDLPAIVACSFSFMSVARLWLSVLLCSAIVDILKFALPFTNVKFVWGIYFNCSSWLVQISQIIFFCWPILKILSHGNFSFHFLNVASFRNFWSLSSSILQTTNHSSLLSYYFLKFVNKAVFWSFTLILFCLQVFILLTAFVL